MQCSDQRPQDVFFLASTCGWCGFCKFFFPVCTVFVHRRRKMTSQDALGVIEPEQINNLFIIDDHLFWINKRTKTHPLRVGESRPIWWEERHSQSLVSEDEDDDEHSHQMRSRVYGPYMTTRRGMSSVYVQVCDRRKTAPIKTTWFAHTSAPAIANKNNERKHSFLPLRCWWRTRICWAVFWLSAGMCWTYRKRVEWYGNRFRAVNMSFYRMV